MFLTKHGSRALGAVEDWARDEFEPWRGQTLTYAAVDAAIDELVASEHDTYRYDIGADGVSCRAKPAWQANDRGVTAEVFGGLKIRAGRYREFLEHAAIGLNPIHPVPLAVNVNDQNHHAVDFPLFAFQRPQGQNFVLLPDIDMLTNDFFESEGHADRKSFADKRNAAIFVGSTTGAGFTLAMVRDLAAPRLRAAAYFKGHPSVVFRLPNIVQCDGPTTAAAIEAMGVGGEWATWSEQLDYRYLLSMDGNGATCSRVALALASNSALVKYQSNHELFYFKGWTSGVHYIPVETDAEVEQVIAEGTATPEYPMGVASQGRAFFETHLTRASCYRYTRALLQAYVDLFR